MEHHFSLAFWYSGLNRYDIMGGCNRVSIVVSLLMYGVADVIILYSSVIVSWRC
jgi:hypothetical protein